VSKFLDRGIEKFSGRRSDFILPNVVDTSLFFHKPEKYSRFSFIHVSNMVPIKNIPAILEAFGEVVNRKGKGKVQLIMIGNRDQEFVNLAKSMGLLNEDVFFRGEIPYTDVAMEMKRSHALVIFSQSETFSCVTAEALCSGLPVITSDTGALPELVNNHNGILVPVGNTVDLARAMLQMIDNYQNYDLVSIAASASAKYGYSAVSEQFQQLYHSDSLD
jgi:glycosyltransferase involved in cell wall biosynthesis